MEKHAGNYNNSLFLFTKIAFTYYTVTKTCAELTNIAYTNYAVTSNQHLQLKMFLPSIPSIDKGEDQNNYLEAT